MALLFKTQELRAIAAEFVMTLLFIFSLTTSISMDFTAVLSLHTLYIAFAASFSLGMMAISSSCRRDGDGDSHGDGDGVGDGNGFRMAIRPLYIVMIGL